MNEKLNLDKSNLATALLQWESKKRELAELEKEIKDIVLQLGESQTAGNVKATYSQGRKKYNYQEAADGHPMVESATIKLFTSAPKARTNWRKICAHVGIYDIPFEQDEPSVTLKINN